MSKISHNFFFQQFLRFFEVCRSGDLVNFLKVCGSAVLEEVNEKKGKRKKKKKKEKRKRKKEKKKKRKKKKEKRKKREKKRG